jgi:predicted nucleotidyltransferase
MAAIRDIVKQRAQEAIALLSDYGSVRAAFLFGSQINGHADDFSDVDIAAFIEGLESWNLDRQIRVTIEVQKRVGDDIELHFFPAESLKNPLPASFAEYVQAVGIRITE